MAFYSYKLEIEKYKNDILKMIEKNKTTIIKGPTGCGKSTYIPLLFRDKRVAIIEPRRIAVKSIYNTLKGKIDNLGYKMRFDKKVCEETKVVIYTDGSFMNEILENEYEYIIIDEVHERSERMDVIMGILRTDFKGKLILMSASIDSESLERYFGASVFEVPGKGHPVDIRYLENPTSNYVYEAYFTIKNILKNRECREKKDILVFLTGEEDILELYTLCKRIPGIAVYCVYSGMKEKEQMKIFEESNLVKVILSTNICETSLTIPNIKYVIDSGLCKMRIFDGINKLGIQGVSWESAMQRMGRCNRLGPGVCYKLYTEYEILGKQILPIVRSDLCGVVLKLLSFKKNIFKFEFLDFPSIDNCLHAIEFLISKGCVDIICDINNENTGYTNNYLNTTCTNDKYNNVSNIISYTNNDCNNCNDCNDKHNNDCNNCNDKHNNDYNDCNDKHNNDCNNCNDCNDKHKNNYNDCNDKHNISNIDVNKFDENKKNIQIRKKKFENIKILLEKIDNGDFIDYSKILEKIKLRITKYGRRIVQHPFEPALANFYEQAIENGIGYDASLLLSLVSQENINFMNSYSKKEKKSDILYLRDLFKEYLESENKHKFCSEKNLSFKAFETGRMIFKTLNKSKKNDDELLEKIFSSSFSHNICTRMDNGTYKMIRNGLEVFIHPSSAFFKKKVRKIVVLDVFSTTKTYARVVGKYYG